MRDLFFIWAFISVGVLCFIIGYQNGCKRKSPIYYGIYKDRIKNNEVCFFNETDKIKDFNPSLKGGSDEASRI